ncbi:MAG: glycosyltransferase [Paracoccaceae bacterium]
MSLLKEQQISPQGRALDTSFSNVAVVVPCLNEEANIERVVSSFLQNLPGAHVFVYDNDSSDRTAEIASTAGALVYHEPKRGKGHAVRRIFSDVEAEIFVLVDGDGTYDATAAPQMIERLRRDNLDMVIGRRVDQSKHAYRPGHRFGNRMMTVFLARLFGSDLNDVLSGYRVMSRRFVKSFPVGTSGFEIETEMTIHMLQIDAPYTEMDTSYSERSAESPSKLRTVPDGFRVLGTMLQLYVAERPLVVFGASGVIAVSIALMMFLPILAEYQHTGLVTRIPTLIVSAVFGLIGLVSVFSGLILAGITRTRRDIKRLAYLAQSSVSG